MDNIIMDVGMSVDNSRGGKMNKAKVGGIGSKYGSALVPVLTMVLVLVLMAGAASAAEVTAATGGDNISADNFGSGAWTSLGTITISESTSAEIGAGTIILTLPTGFEYNTTVNPRVSVGGNAEVQLVATFTSISATQLIVTVESSSSGEELFGSELSIGDTTAIQVRPTAGNLPSGNISMDSGSTSDIAGVTEGPEGDNFGTLQEVAGAATTFSLSATATQDAGASNTLTITAKDQYGNTATGYTDDKTLTFGGAAAAPDGTSPTASDKTSADVNFGTGTTVTFASGVATTTLKLYKAETAGINVTDATRSEDSAFSIVVSPSAATQVVMTPATDTSTVAGQGITFTATLQDANGNQVDFTGAANVTFSGGIGSWGANALASGVITSVYTTNTTVVTGEVLTVTENVDTPAGDENDTSTITTGAGAATKVRVETAADGSGTVVGAQDVVSGSAITVYAITRDADDNFVANVAADTWSLTGKSGGVADGDLVPVPPAPEGNGSAIFTGALVGTAVIHVTSGELAGDSGTITVNGAANNTNVDEKKVFTATSGYANVTGTFSNNLTGWINITAVGNATNSSEVNQSSPRYGLGYGDKIVSGVTVNVSEDSNIASELGENGTIRIQICYNATTLTALGIDASTLAIWKYDNHTEKWVKQSSTTTSEGCVYTDVNHLCTFVLVGSKATPSGGGGSGGSGTYPPGWFGTPTVTATKAPAATTTATAAPPDDKATPAPTKKPAVTKATAPTAEGTTAETAKKSAPGFTAVFAIAGMLAVAYAMMRRRE